MSLPKQLHTDSFSPHWRVFRRERLTVLMGEQLDADDLQALQGLDHPHVALFTPLSWYTLRDRMDQQWTVNDPKQKAEETLYSSTSLFHAQGDNVQQVLQLAQTKGWAVYAFDDEQAFCLVLTTGMAFDIDRNHLLTHVEES